MPYQGTDRVMITTRIDYSFKRRIDDAAAKLGQSVNRFVIEAVESRLALLEPPVTSPVEQPEPEIEEMCDE